MRGKSIRSVSLLLAAITTSPLFAQLPPGWSSLEIGDPMVGGSARYDETTETWRIAGGGRGIRDGSDEFHFVYKSVVRKSELVTRVISISPPPFGSAMAGLMIRETLSSSSPCLFIGGTPDARTNTHSIVVSRRVQESRTAQHESAEGMTAPYWLKATSVGGAIAVYSSTDGRQWIERGHLMLSRMFGEVHLGYAVMSVSLSGRATAVFDRGPAVASNPQPPNGALGVRTSLLQWRPASAALEQSVFFGRKADLVAANEPNTLAGTTDRGILAIGSVLDLNTTYYWSVSTVTTGNEVNLGPVWSFTTSDSAPELADITRPWDTIEGLPLGGDWLLGGEPSRAIDNQAGLSYLPSAPPTVVNPIGFAVTPFVGPTIVTELTVATGRDDPPLDPISFELSGSNDSIDGPYEMIVSGDIVDFAQETPWPRLTQNETEISFQNEAAYGHYQLVFPAVRGLSRINSIHIAQDPGASIGEVELKGVPESLVGPSDAYLVGTVRNILTGARIPNTGQTCIGTVSFGPCRGHGSASFSIDPDYWVEMVAGACYTATVDANNYQGIDPIDVQLMTEGHTIRDFALWPDSVSHPPSHPVYRFRSPGMPYLYYFTADRFERDDLLFDDPNQMDVYVETRDPDNWVYNGIAFCAPEDVNDPNLALVHCFMRNNDNMRIPAYAFSEADLEPLDTQVDWVPHPELDDLDGIFQAYPDPQEGTKAVHRFWSESSGCYFYTMDVDEPNTWTNRGHDWEYSGEAWHVSTQEQLSVP
jgi:hypothetical protein